jgi:hypothetical protein
VNLGAKKHETMERQIKARRVLRHEPEKIGL